MVLGRPSKGSDPLERIESLGCDPTDLFRHQGDGFGYYTRRKAEKRPTPVQRVSLLQAATLDGAGACEREAIPSVLRCKGKQDKPEPWDSGRLSNRRAPAEDRHDDAKLLF